MLPAHEHVARAIVVHNHVLHARRVVTRARRVDGQVEFLGERQDGVIGPLLGAVCLVLVFESTERSRASYKIQTRQTRSELSKE